MKNPQNITSPFINPSNARKVRLTIDKTTNSFTNKDSYGGVLPSNLNIFSDIAPNVIGLNNTVVKEQVRSVLSSLYLSLQRASKQSMINNYLSRINLIQQQDETALLEWSFQDFRVGFTLEPDKNESGFFVVSQDKSAGSFMADTKKLEDDISISVEKIVKYVLENT